MKVLEAMKHIILADAQEKLKQVINEIAYYEKNKE